MFDQDYDTAAQEWLEGLKNWTPTPYCKYYWEDVGNPPDPSYYRPKFAEEPTWFQVYQTVSEGYPVSPPFATQEELIDYLAAHGDFWGQNRGEPPPSREAAEQFVRSGFALSMVATSDGTVARGIHTYDLPALKEE